MGCSETIESQFKTVVLTVANLLKSQGFKKRGRALYRVTNENVELIEFQRSLANTAQNLCFTVNVGIISVRLARHFEKELSKAGSVDAHLRRRIGDFLPQPHDKWWELNTVASPKGVIEELSSLLVEKVVPYLTGHSSDVALVSLWEGGQSPGLTEGLRVRFLSALKADA